MTDLHTRFRTLDNVSAPNLWYDIEERAMAMQPTTRRLSWVLIVVTLLLTLIIGGAALVGSGIVKLPVSVETSATPSPTADPSSSPSSTPDEHVAGAWVATGNMTTPRIGPTATLLRDGKVLVAGGYSSGDGDGGPLASAELYDPGTGSWTATGGMIEARGGHTATLLPDGRVLVVGGNSHSGLPASAELYDPGSGTWTATESMGGGRVAHTATLLLDGKVLVTGGYRDSSGPFLPLLASAELYDPGSGSWTATGNMIGARFGHTATLLRDGKVLVAGGGSGTDGDGGPLASAELYDPTSGSWTATGSMIEAGPGHPATLLTDGRVLVVGGGSNGSIRRAVRAGQRVVDSHREYGRGPLRSHGHPAARWQGAGGGRQQQRRPTGHRRTVRPEQRVLDRHREHGRGPRRSDGHPAAQWQGTGGGRWQQRQQRRRPIGLRRGVRPQQRDLICRY